MKRSMMQAYVKGSAEAVALYQRAFGAPLVSSYLNADGSYYHSELDVQGQIFAVAEASDALDKERITGNTMQFCFHYGEGNEAFVKKAYEVLRVDGKILFPLGPCEFSSLMADLTDKFGVRWCLFV